MEVFGWASAVLFSVAYLPQIIRTHRLKSVDDLSIGLFCVTQIAYICGLVYGIYLDKYALIFSYLAGFSLTTVITLQWLIYRDPRKDQVRSIVRKALKDLKEREL